ncbi:MAG: hypothetical protein AAF829_07745 [Pseudomonadota bacterium]
MVLSWTTVQAPYIRFEMSHLYPLAQSAEEALAPERPAARTRHDAERHAFGTEILKLATAWISDADGDVDVADVRANAGLSQGFIQAYEDENGKPVYAITYWQLKGPLGDASAQDLPSVPAPVEIAAQAKPKSDPENAPAEDHTDDLYFRSKRSKRGRKRYVDPRQMDLFTAPDARGYEHTEGGAVITDEEGDGTTFGG